MDEICFYSYGKEPSLEYLTQRGVDIIYFSNGFILCYSRFDHSRSLQTLVQILASKFVVMISSTLAQYSEGVKKKFGDWVPPTSTEGPPIM